VVNTLPEKYPYTSSTIHITTYTHRNHPNLYTYTLCQHKKTQTSTQKGEYYALIYVHIYVNIHLLI